MANTKKITKREVINELLKEDLIQDTPMYKTYLEHELELLDKKNASAKGVDKSQENKEIEDMIIATLENITNDEKSQFTVTEIMKAIGYVLLVVLAIVFLSLLGALAPIFKLIWSFILKLLKVN